MVELERKKVMVRPSQAELTKVMYAIIGEERNSRMVKPKTLEASQWKRNEKRKPHSCLKPTFNILMNKY
jgi:hypothetical protein